MAVDTGPQGKWSGKWGGGNSGCHLAQALVLVSHSQLPLWPQNPHYSLVLSLAEAFYLEKCGQCSISQEVVTRVQHPLPRPAEHREKGCTLPHRHSGAALLLPGLASCFVQQPGLFLAHQQ